MTSNHETSLLQSTPMSIIRKFLGVLVLCQILVLNPISALAQRRPKKSDSAGISREEALKQKEAQKAAKVAEYEAQKEHLRDIQSKSTQKRMKKNLKKARRLSKGKDIPLHKRIFRRKKTV